MDDMNQEDIEKAVTDHHQQLWGKKYSGKANEAKTTTAYGHYVDVIWELLGRMPAYDERQLYQNTIRDLPTKEYARAIERLHPDLQNWDTKKTSKPTLEQDRKIALAWKPRQEDIQEERDRPLETEESQEENKAHKEDGTAIILDIITTLNDTPVG
jgi:hypothetical protein